MPVPAYMKVTGSSQGNITEGASTGESMGNKWQQGHEDEVRIEAFEHQITIPRDPQAGQPSGQRVHKGMTVTKTFDKSSPLLYNALCSGERVDVELNWYRTSEGGTQELYYTHTLEDATIVDIKAYMPNCQDPQYSQFTHLEEVTFTYRKITWEHKVSQTVGEDDWRAPK